MRERGQQPSSTNQLGKLNWGLAQDSNKLADTVLTTQPSPKDFPSLSLAGEREKSMDAVHRLDGGQVYIKFVLNFIYTLR